MSETSEVTRPLLVALAKLGVYAVRVQSGRLRVRGGWMHLAPEGTPDISGFYGDGRGFVVETKKSCRDGCPCKSCAAQRRVRVELETRHVKYVFARSVDSALQALGLAPLLPSNPRENQEVG